MFNITNKIYVEHLNNFAGRFKCIMIDGGKYDGIAFQDGYTPIARYKSFDIMINEEYDGNISNFWKFLHTTGKLKIFATEQDYIKIYTSVIAELFGIISNKTVLPRFLELIDIYEYLQTGKNLDFTNTFNELTSSYKISGDLYNNSDIQIIPTDFAIFLYDNGELTKDQINSRIAFLANPLLESFLISLIQLVKKIITRNPKYLNQYLNISTIKSLKDIEQAIKNNDMLNKIFGFYHIEMTNLDEIMKLYRIALLGNNRPVDLIDIEEMDLLYDFYQGPTIDKFKANIQNILESQFFSRRFNKFNDLLLESVTI